jgi:hypothetical protein
MADAAPTRAAPLIFFWSSYFKNVHTRSRSFTKILKATAQSILGPC